jgi:hypothetical protein
MPNLRINLRRAAIFAGIFFLFLLVVEFNSRLEELNRLNDQRDQVRMTATQAAQTEMALKTQVAYANSAAAVEEWARTEGHYVLEGDQAVVPLVQPGSQPVIAPTVQPTPTPMQNWEVWWTLFFDE